MADLIYRDKLLAAYDAAHKGPPGEARKLIVEAPAVDAVPVVRCKDCMFYNTSGRPDGLGWCETSRIYNIVRDDFYCGDSEKREG